MLGGHSTGGLSLGVIIGARALVGCGSEQESALVASDPKRRARARRVQRAPTPSTSGFSNSAKGRAALAAPVPERANQATRLCANSVQMELRAEGAADHAREVYDGRVVKPRVFADTDLVIAALRARSEELRILRSLNAPAEASYTRRVS